MLFSAIGKWLSGLAVAAPSSSLQVNTRRGRRRGATAMEYLAVISLIFIVAMTAINYFGQETKKNMQNSTETIQKATQGNQSTSP